MAVIEIEIFGVVGVKAEIWGHFPLFSHTFPQTLLNMHVRAHIVYIKYIWLIPSKLLPEGYSIRIKMSWIFFVWFAFISVFSLQTIHWTVFRRPQKKLKKEFKHKLTQKTGRPVASTNLERSFHWPSFCSWLTSRRRYDFQCFCMATKLKLHHSDSSLFIIMKISLFHSFILHLFVYSLMYCSNELIEWLWRHFYRTHLHISTQCVYWMSLRCVIQNASWMSILDSLFGAFLRNHVSHGLGLAIYHFVLHFRGIFILMHSCIFVLTDKCLFIFEMNISISLNSVLHSIPLAIPDRLFIHSYASYARRFFPTSL